MPAAEIVIKNCKDAYKPKSIASIDESTAQFGSREESNSLVSAKICDERVRSVIGARYQRIAAVDLHETGMKAAGYGNIEWF
ncbi:hypothetical protein KIN20_008430 [Parelaphostrongylus tenuis]|uniref:Uncharacterized protein n=1 Tax=Parelaphostrongylus tenuis TaxID=148309 RepID=A0AAD5MNX0_PARTN|nr:hypothetical protein KIN20_008430 [Parelaphostrongylus tenuis]